MTEQRLIEMMIDAYVEVMGAEKWDSMNGQEQHDIIMAMVKGATMALDRIEKGLE